MVAELDNFRAKFPEYGDMDDVTLANKLAAKFPEYGDLPGKVQIKPQPMAEQKPIEPQTTSDIFGLMHGGGDITEGQNLNPQAMQGLQNAYTTTQNIGQVLPVADMAANFITSLYGIPTSGIAGLAGLATGGLDRANEWLNATQKALVYQPQTPGGQQLTQAAGAPLAPFQEAGAYWGGKLEESGYPNLGAGIHSALEASPLILLRKQNVAKRQTSAIDADISKVVRKAVNKGIRPSIVGKSDFKQMEKHYKNYETAVQDIIEANPDKVPQTIAEASKANLDTKIKLWDDATKLSGQAGQAGAIVSFDPIVAEMRSLASHPDMVRMNKAGSQKLLEMADAWESLPTKVSPMEAEATLAKLNDLAKGFWKDPDPNSLGMGANMERLASVLRKQLTGAVEQYGGKGYGDFRKRYGAQSAIEKELANRALVDARKAPSGFFDLLDAASASEFAHGLIGMSPASMASAAVIRGTKWALKRRNDPNVIIADMFNKTKDLMDRKKLLNGETVKNWGESEASSAGSPLVSPITGYPMEQSVINPNLPKSPITGEVLGLDKGLRTFRPPKQRATLIPTPTVKAPRPEPLPSVETPVNMLEGIPFTPEQLAIMSRRFVPNARQMGIQDIIDTKTAGPLKADIPNLTKDLEVVIRKEPEISTIIANTPRIGGEGVPPQAIAAMSKVNAFRRSKGLDPLTSGDMKAVKDYYKQQARGKINEFRQSKGLPPL